MTPTTTAAPRRVVDAEGAVVLRISDPGGVGSAIAVARDADRHGASLLIVDPLPVAGVDPFPVAAAVAVVTDFTGIGVIAPLDHWHPYLIARRLAEIDKLAAGRLCWAPRDPDPDRRAEATTIVDALLTSWPASAILADREAGRHIDLGRITPVRHHGRYYRIDSPLDVPGGPQGAVPLLRFGLDTSVAPDTPVTTDGSVTTVASGDIAPSLDSDRREERQ